MRTWTYLLGAMIQTTTSQLLEHLFAHDSSHYMLLSTLLFCMIHSCASLFNICLDPLECNLPTGRNFVCLVHKCVPSTQQDDLHILGVQ